MFSQVYIVFMFYSMLWVVRFFISKLCSVFYVVVFLARVSELNPHMHNLACAHRPNYAFASLFIRMHEPAQKP